MVWGGWFSVAGLENGLAMTGWHFFPGSSMGSSAGRFTPAIPPTAGAEHKVIYYKIWQCECTFFHSEMMLENHFLIKI